MRSLLKRRVVDPESLPVMFSRLRGAIVEHDNALQAQKHPHDRLGRLQAEQDRMQWEQRVQMLLRHVQAAGATAEQWAQAFACPGPTLKG